MRGNEGAAIAGGGGVDAHQRAAHRICAGVVDDRLRRVTRGGCFSPKLSARRAAPVVEARHSVEPQFAARTRVMRALDFVVDEVSRDRK